jgi:hypothetical protein
MRMRYCTAPVPLATDEIVKLARQLGRPVALGYLPVHQGDAAVLAYCCRLAREGQLDQDPFEVAQIAQHVLRLNANHYDAEQRKTIGAIRRALRPMLAIRASSNRLRAAAHNENGARGFLLPEEVVDEIVAAEILNIMEPEARHG